MKKQLLNLGAACLALVLAGNVMGQTQMTATANGTETAFTIDGVAEEAWENYSPVAIERPFVNETPTLEEATWQAAWSEEGMYVIVSVIEDAWFPHFVSGSAGWESDHIELYFDLSDPQVDGLGALNADGNAAGNWQVAPDMIEGTDAVTTDQGTVHANTYDEVGGYIREYFVPWTHVTKGGEPIVAAEGVIIGFDVTVVDRDALAADGGVRNRMSWSNDGTVAESWNNCDGVGLVTFGPYVGSVSSKVANTNILKSNVVKNEIVFNTKVSDVKVLNTMGQVVRTGNNVADLANGVYIVTATTNEGVVANRFVKQ